MTNNYSVLKTHSFNYNDFNTTLRIIKKFYWHNTSENSNFKSLYDFAIQTTVPLVSNTGEIIEHKLYHIIVKEGIRTNDKPSIVDSVYLSYKGKLLNGIEFDKKSNPVWFDTLM